MKIKKIDIPQSTAIDASVLWGGINDNVLAAKINELIDVINKQQDIIRQIGEWGSSKGECLWCEKLTEVNLDSVNELQATISKMEKVETSAENVQDKFAEQRRWIGCVCRFWFDNPNDTLLDYLDKIQTGKNGVEYYAKESGDWFPHCEPVKPTDSIIYKGEKCETPAENVQPDYVTTTYPTDGHTKEYYGQNGASIVTDYPLPAGYVITIRESETKGGNNE